VQAAEAGETHWQRVRELFPFREERVPMNAANLCPSPESVAKTVTELTRSIDVDCSFQNRARFASDRETARTLVASQLGADADEVALVRNTSEANNIINNGLDLQAGDEVVIWDQNHPTNNVAWAVRARRRGFTVQTVSVPPHPSDPDELIQPFRSALTAKTRVLALTHASNISGILLPVRELCAIAHRSGVHVHVDGAQTWGALQVDLHELGCDSYAASAHKWFCGPKEVGLLYTRRERIGDIWPNTVAPGWGSTADTELVGARKFESMGQRDDAALSALGGAAEFHGSIGTAQVESRVRELASLLKQSLHSIGARLVTPKDQALSAGVCIVEVPPEKRQALFNAMYDEFGIAGSTAGGFRLCPHIYNTREHVERAVRGLAKHRSLWA
jgi:selenocysteine lyase/cysteine desulfurase